MRELKIGFLQQHNVEDIKNNIERLAEGITNLAQRGAELVILQELHNSLYFCQTEDVNKFDLAETIPGPSTGFYGELARELGIVIVISLFEKRAPGLYHNTAVVIEKDGSIAGSIVRCTFQMIQLTMRSSTSHQAISDSTQLIQVWDVLVYLFAGISGILKQPA